MCYRPHILALALDVLLTNDPATTALPQPTRSSPSCKLHSASALLTPTRLRQVTPAITAPTM